MKMEPSLEHYNALRTAALDVAGSDKVLRQRVIGAFSYRLRKSPATPTWEFVAECATIYVLCYYGFVKTPAKHRFEASVIVSLMKAGVDWRASTPGSKCPRWEEISDEWLY